MEQNSHIIDDKVLTVNHHKDELHNIDTVSEVAKTAISI